MSIKVTEHKPYKLFTLSGNIRNKRKRTPHRNLQCEGSKTAGIKPHSYDMIVVDWAKWKLQFPLCETCRRHENVDSTEGTLTKAEQKLVDQHIAST